MTKSKLEKSITKKSIKKVIAFHIGRITYHDETVEYDMHIVKTAKKKWDRVHARESISVNIHEGNFHRRLLGIRVRKVPKIALIKEETGVCK